MPKRCDVIVIDKDGEDVVDLRGWARLYAREVLDQHVRAQRDELQDEPRAPALHELPKAG